MTEIAPVRKHIVVNATQEHAFEVFTAGFDRWWPREHHIGSSPMARAIMEPRPGGRWYAVCQDGTECDTGKVLVWDPPRRLVLAWQLTGEWQHDPEFVTEVEVTFAAEGPRRTAVTLEHRNLERYGAKVEEIRKGIDAPGGWMLTLERFGKVVEE